MRAALRSLLCLLSLFATAHGRTFTDSQGRTLEAEIVSYDGGDSVEIRRSDGQTFSLPLARLSPADQAYVREWKPAPAAPFDAEEMNRLNELLGVPLFVDGDLWDDDPAAVASRLGWPLESETATQSSYRQYNRPDERILGARPYSSVLYGRDGRVDTISIVFANKGDSVGDRKEKSESEMDKLVKEAITRDGDTISAKLATLGEPEQLTTATGRSMKERLKLWTWRDHVIALALQDGEYVAVRIMPASLAANRGRPERVNSSTISAQALANVIQRPNGDVVIGNIPMVNQGPKGYCVPATLERVLRYMDVRADMYLLAMAGQTEIGGGTNVDELIKGTERYVNAAGREMESARVRIRVRDIAKYIDQGQPILWGMSTTDEFNLLVNEFTDRRAGLDNPDQWKQWLDEKRKAMPELAIDPKRGHICLIIGYNANTDEIAVSDSWGPQYSERWAPAESVEQVSLDAFWVVEF